MERNEVVDTTPSWLDRELYPFRSHHVQLDAGRMHYVDEGSGQPIVMVHGTPTWSFLYRHFIRELSGEFRTIAPDNLGFGLSEKPGNFSYTPEAHARNLERFIGALNLENIVLVVHDFGGPIGLSYAIRNPQRVKAIVVLNTWMWSLKGDWRMKIGGRGFSTWLGRLLFERFDFSVRVVFAGAYADRSRLTPPILRHYTAPLSTPRDRRVTWILARELLGSSRWYDNLWERRAAIAGKPALLLWGMKDAAFRDQELRRFESMFERSRTVRFDDAGHAVQEEAWAPAAEEIRRFVREQH